MRNPTIPTRADALRAAAAAGLTGEAAELWAAAGASCRHAARVEAAKAAALAWASCAPGEEPTELQLCAAWAATRLDAHGVGGPRAAGGTGSGTTRHPAFAGLGKGRKFARDGGAWSAAIEGAGYALALALDPDRGAPGLTFDGVGDAAVTFAGGNRWHRLPDRPEEADHLDCFARHVIVAAAKGGSIDPEDLRCAGIRANKAHAARAEAIAAREAAIAQSEGWIRQPAEGDDE